MCGMEHCSVVIVIWLYSSTLLLASRVEGMSWLFLVIDFLSQHPRRKTPGAICYSQHTA